MALGTSTTQKGKRIDFAELKRRAKKPVQSVYDVNMKSTTMVQKPLAPVQRARGFMPSHTNVRIPEYDRPAPAGAFEQRTKNKPIETKSLMDYTEIKIEEPKHMRGVPQDAHQTSNEALAEILRADQMRSKQQASQPVPRRRRT